MEIRTLRKNSRDIVISARIKDIRHMNVGPRPPTLKDLKVIVTNVKSMDTRHMNANPNLSGHQTNRQR